MLYRVIFLLSIFSIAQQDKGVMGCHRYHCQSNTQVSCMTSKVVMPLTRTTAVSPSSLQPHVWMCLISTSKDLVEGLRLLSCHSLSYHRSNWSLRSGRAQGKCNPSSQPTYLHCSTSGLTLTLFWGNQFCSPLRMICIYPYENFSFLLTTAAVKMKQALSAMWQFRSHLNKGRFPLPYFLFPLK